MQDVCRRSPVIGARRWMLRHSFPVFTFSSGSAVTFQFLGTSVKRNLRQSVRYISYPATRKFEFLLSVDQTHICIIAEPAIFFPNRPLTVHILVNNIYIDITRSEFRPALCPWLTRARHCESTDNQHRWACRSLYSSYWNTLLRMSTYKFHHICLFMHVVCMNASLQFCREVVVWSADLGEHKTVGTTWAAPLCLSESPRRSTCPELWVVACQHAVSESCRQDPV